jgi:hypothetical protein
MVSQKKIDEIARKHSTALKALEEFEKTGRIVLKTRMNFTIDREIAKKFKEACRKHRYNMSQKVQEAMEQIVERDK